MVRRTQAADAPVVAGGRGAGDSGGPSEADRILTGASQAHCRRAGRSACRDDRHAYASDRPDGFSSAELLVALGIIGVLIALILPLIGRARASAQSVTCLSQLRQIGGAFLQYAADNDKRLPDPFVLQTSWEQILRRYMPDPAVFHCPADSELFPAVGSSFDWRDTGRPETTLAGRLVSDTNRHDVVLAFEALPGWHLKGRMNAFMLNGSGQSMDQEACMEDLQQPIRVPLNRPPGVPLPKGVPGSY